MCHVLWNMLLLGVAAKMRTGIQIFIQFCFIKTTFPYSFHFLSKIEMTLPYICVVRVVTWSCRLMST